MPKVYELSAIDELDGDERMYATQYPDWEPADGYVTPDVIKAYVSQSRIYVSALEFQAGAAGPALTNTGDPWYMARWLLDPGSSEHLIAPAHIPRDWNTYNAYAWFITITSAASADVQFVYYTPEYWAASVTGATVGGVVTVPIQGGAANAIQRHELGTGLVRPTTNYWEQMYVQRWGGHASDTYTADIGFVGLELIRAS